MDRKPEGKRGRIRTWTFSSSFGGRFGRAWRCGAPERLCRRSRWNPTGCCNAFSWMSRSLRQNQTPSPTWYAGRAFRSDGPSSESAAQSKAEVCRRAVACTRRPLEDAISCSYYSMFHIAAAFLEGEGLRFSSHAAVLGFRASLHQNRAATVGVSSLSPGGTRGPVGCGLPGMRTPSRRRMRRNTWSGQRRLASGDRKDRHAALRGCCPLRVLGTLEWFQLL